MRTTREELPADELQQMIVELLTREGRALTSSEIHKGLQKAYRPPAKRVSLLVRALVESRRIFPVGKRYRATPDRTLHESIVAALAGGPLSAAELGRRLPAKPKAIRDAIGELHAEGVLHTFPKHERKVRYGLHAPSSAEMLAPALPALLDKFLAKAAKLGIDEAAARAALLELLGGSPSPADHQRNDPTETLLAALRDFHPGAASGALIFLPHLRSAVADRFHDKTSFDRTVLGLLAGGAVDMQSHPTPSLLSASEREAMIENGRGGYYTAIALR